MAKSQDSIRSTRFSRMAALSGAGAKVGVNYLKHYGRKAVRGDASKEKLHEDNARDVYATFSELKGGPLKLAQMLSIDQNVLPEAYTSTFAQAQYSAPPLSYPLVEKTFRRELGKTPSALFDSFSREAAHGASIGQVHRAKLGSEHFAVKVQYPGVADSLKSDLRVMKPFALSMLGLKEKDVEPYFLEVEQRLLEETDYSRELEESISLSEASVALPGIRFPRYFPELSSRRILTMEWIDGQTLDKFADSDASQEERDRIAQSLWDFYHFQVHTLRRFHADPHPGNFLVDPEGMLVVLDFGCTKAIPDSVYGDYFRILQPEVVQDLKRFESALEKLEILRPDDPPKDRALLLKTAHEGAELLSRPFHVDTFDFGDASYMASLYEMGDNNGKNSELRKIDSARGTHHALYINRAYFGVYSLMGRLRARIRAQVPEVSE